MAARSSTSSKDAGPFDLFIAGLPRKFKWQDLKDLVRQHASHGIHTEILNQFDADGNSQGEARVLRSEEAFKLYQFLIKVVIQGRHLHVHMFDLSNDNCKFLCCNCDSGDICPVTRQRRVMNPGGPTVRPMVSQPPYHPMLSMAPVMGGPSAVPPPLHARPMLQTPYYTHVPIMQPMIPVTQAHQDPGLDLAMSRLYLSNQRPLPYASIPPTRLPQTSPNYYHPSTEPYYLANSTGTPINTSNGVVKTEARGIFVSNLKYKATESEVYSYFSSVGTVKKIDLHKDPKTKKSKGYATVLYEDARTAARAIERFDGREFMGMVLKVRFDKETTAVGGTGWMGGSGGSGARAGSDAGGKTPVIVNGTTSGRERQDSPLAANRH